MSVQCLSHAFEHSQAEGNAFVVMLVLADHAGQNGWACYPSVKRISHYARCSESAVHRALRRLVELGELDIDDQAAFDSRIPANRKTNLYRVFPQMWITSESGVSVAAPQDGLGVSPARLRGVSNVDLGVPPVAPKPSLEPLKNQRKSSESYPQSTYKMPEPRPFCSKCDGWLDGEGPKELLCTCRADLKAL